MKKVGLLLLWISSIALAVAATWILAERSYRSELVRLKGDAAIYRTEAENYAKALRSIREATDAATPIEKVVE